ncbi:FHA domain-containing protein [Actinomadura sp. ATCC 31491]|uniref:FHA domain-containing protein n=1 Tax=Actinomadura luzonensis TaxID=2805427 RepID=A0ABT0FRZ2_9ACTN|nr:FtsK/SpoIIIE domain-containing protein [Actinomadura luzonensis]MCK2214923.1 FHA domain-containing protein [Actinomadura luzonensis]
MIIRTTIRDPATSAECDVEVTAEPGTTVGSLLRALPVPVAGRPCFVGTGKLDPEATVAGGPIVPGATISIGEPERAQPWRPLAAAGALRVFAGPDAGRVIWVSPGAHVVGRDQTGVCLPYDQRVSRQHARLDVSWTGEVTVTDLGSRNGTLVDELPVREPVPLRPDGVLQVGDDRLRWAPLPPSRLRTTRAADGRIDFDRAFSPAPAVPAAVITLPRNETPQRNTAAALLSSLLPLPISVAMAILLKSPYFLLFGILTPITFFATQWVEGRQRARKEREFDARKHETLERIRRHVVREQWLRHLVAPDEVDLTYAATHEGPGLWPRNADSPDGLTLRVGVADEPAAIRFDGEPWPGFAEPVLRGVPVTVDLREIGVLGVIGPPEPVDALLRWLLVQLGTLRAPDELRLVLITASGGERLAWTRWLPHLAPDGGPVPCLVGNTPETRTARVEELRDLVTDRLKARDQHRRFAEEVVVVLDGARALRDVPGVREVLREGPSVGVHVICADQRSLNECRGVCELDGASMLLTRARRGLPAAVRPEGLSEAAAERIARAVAPMRDRLTLARAERVIPSAVRLLDVLGGELTPEGVLARWATDPGPTTRVVVGADGAGPVTVDLAADGPHTMLGGATGAGKSILLQTLVTSLLLANRPDELNLVLVDFKGGSAFLPFEHCPHVVGLIRSTGDTAADVFDESAARRVLASVRAEVRRREAILARHGGEIDAYWAAGGRLPRLVMVFDEFARVLESSPDFLRELVNVAAKGRSLGMHLVLATQSLQGKLSPELRNNISLRVTLRQNEPSDSVEVLGVPDAAAIPSRLRGRGMIMRVGGEQRTPQLFQTGYLGDPPPAAGAAPARARVLPWTALGLPRPEPPSRPANGPTDQDLAIAAVRAAAGRLAFEPPFRPLLPPLPAALDLTAILPPPAALDPAPPPHPSPAASPAPSSASPAASPAASDPALLPGAAAARGRHAARSPAPGDPPPVPFALLDDPALQAQPAMTLDLAGTERLLVAGGPQSGRTTFARTLISSLATRCPPAQVWLYVIENQPGGLAPYERLPICGAVANAAEPDRIRRLVTWLAGEVDRRRLARPSPRPPVIVLLIDGWEYFENRGDPDFVETSLLVTLRGVVAGGPPVGVHVVAAGGHDMLRGKTPDLFSRRLLLPFAREETRRSYLASSGMVSPPVLPGRAIDAATGLHAQIALPLDPPWPLPGPPFPKSFPPLPAALPLDELAGPPVSVGATPVSAGGIPIGVGGPDVRPVALDLFGAGPHLALVSGPPGSGRSNAALVLATGLLRAGVGVLALAPPRSPLARALPPGARLLTGTAFTDADLRAAAAPFAGTPYAVLLDDFDQLTITPGEQNFDTLPTLLQDLLTPAELGRRALILAGDATPILEGHRRALSQEVTETLRAGARVVLAPSNRVTAREHALTLEPDQFFTGPPGRAYLSVGRRTDLIQIALTGA